MDIDWVKLLSLGAFSGLVAGIINQAAGFFRDMLTRRGDAERDRNKREHERGMQDDQRNHERMLRRSEDHAKARDKMLAEAVGAHEWLIAETIDKYAHDSDYLGINRGRPSIKTATGALEALGRIRTGHPTKAVRKLAKELEDSIDDEYNVLAGDSLGEPTREQLRAWINGTEELIEAIHDPE